MKRIICLLGITLVALCLLVSCNHFNNSNNTNEGVLKDYTVSVSTAGRMVMPGVKLQVYELVNGELGAEVEDAFDITDSEGEFTIQLKNDKSYAVRIISGVPNGYAGINEIYPIKEGNTDIVLTSSVLPETDLDGVSYTPGNVMHDFTITTIDNEVFTLSEVLKTKKAVMLNFWFVGCIWCMVEFPMIDQIQMEYADDIAIVAINPFAEDTPEVIREFCDSLGGFELDFAQVPENFDDAFGVEGFPTSIIIDRYGVITLVESGTLTAIRDLRNVVEYYTSEDYEQRIISGFTALTPELEGTIVIPEGTTEIADYAYSGYNNIETIVIPEGVTKIGKGAFQHCENLKKVVLPDSLKVIDDSAFLCCFGLEEINIPSGVTEIGNYAFMMCQSLNDVYFSDSLSEIGIFAFLYCSSFTKLSIPESVNHIGEGAFMYCNGVTELVILAGAEVIQPQAFLGCASVETVIISKSIKNIGEAVFYDTDNIKDVYYMGTEEEWQKIVIGEYNYSILSANIHFDHAV